MTTTRSSTNLLKDQPLQGLLVLDFSQFLSGPLATLRLADLGARVIKIERPGQGDLGRTLYLSDTDINGENTLFHAINRNKESLAADLKDPRDIEKLRRLIARPPSRTPAILTPVFDSIRPLWGRAVGRLG